MGAWLIMAVNGTLFGMCCFVVANVVTEIGSEALEPMPIAVASAPLEDDGETLRASPSLILERNLFGAQLVGDRQDVEIDTAVPLAATKLPLKLLGTAAANVEDRSRAAIEDTKTRKHMVVAVGDTLDGHLRVRVKAIERTRVILDNAGRTEELALDDKNALARSKVRPRRESKRNRQDRTADKKATLNDRLEKLGGEEGIARVLSSARITPKYVDGEMAGMTVDAIKPDSLFEKIGFQNGDIITEVNGIVIDRISATNAIFDELATANEIDTAVLRDGSAITLSADSEQLMEQQ